MLISDTNLHELAWLRIKHIFAALVAKKMLISDVAPEKKKPKEIQNLYYISGMPWI